MEMERRTAQPRGGILGFILIMMGLALAPACARQAAPQELHDPVVDRTPLLPFQQEVAAATATGDLERAAEALRKALDRVPGDAGTMFRLAQVYVRVGQKEKALDLLSQLAVRNLGFHPEVDPELRSLSSQPGYKELLATLDRLEPIVVRSHQAYVIREPDLFPEGIACDGRSGTLYVSSLLKRKIIRISPDGQITDFVGERQDGLFGVLGMKVDEARGQLWAAASGGPEHAEDEGRSGLWAFDLATGKLVARHLLPSDKPHLLNDLVIADSGDVYATDTATGEIYHVGGPEGSIQPVDLRDSLRAPNGIALSGNRRILYVASSGRGLSAINLDTRELADVRSTADVAMLGIDGLYTDGSDLIAVQNGIGRPRVVRFVLTAPERINRLEILESRHPLHDTPTTAAFCRGNLYYVANPHLQHADSNGALTANSGLSDLAILELPLK